MYHTLFVIVMLLLVGGSASAADEKKAEGQKYPNLPPPVTLLENEKVIVQAMPTPTSWTGLHKHTDNQLAVVIEPFTIEYLDAQGKRTETSYAKGDVFWIGDVEHDHRATTIGRLILVTFK